MARKFTSSVEWTFGLYRGKAEEITPDMVGNVFYEWYNRNVLDDLTKKEIRLSLKIFFNYLKEEKKIINQEVLDSLK